MDTQQPSRPLNISQVPSSGVEKAPFLIRFVAAFIDGLILGFLIFVITFILAFIFKILKMDILATISSWIVQIGASYFYYGKFYASRGATPGKQLFNLRVQDNDTGQNMTEWKAFFREVLGKLISGLILFIGFFMALFREDGRALHDLMFNSRVVRIKK